MTARPLKAIICTYEVVPHKAIELLEKIGDAVGTRFSGIVIDNGGHNSPARIGAWQVHQGSNVLMDFSAYAEGAAMLAPQIESSDAVLVLNDTVFTRHNAKFHLTRLIRYREAVRQTSSPCIAGKTDDYTNICYTNPWSGINAYVSSFAFLLNTAGIEKLQRVYSSIQEVMGSAEVDMSSDQWGPGLDRRFREFLRMHLVQVDSPTAWYQARKYAGKTAVLQKKARCVYLEHKLSGEIGRDGVIIAMYPRTRDKFRFSIADKVKKISSRLAI
jgi:hypothetical protein